MSRVTQGLNRNLHEPEKVSARLFLVSKDSFRLRLNTPALWEGPRAAAI